ncbi:hypothetical protein CMK17_05655 [Candidatus Poribacteria bacterium]|nr:hypothetical protein [Candidatus Poribacteria bacterium]
MYRFLSQPDSLQLDPAPEVAVNLYNKKKTFVAQVVDKYRISHASSPNHCWHVILDIKGSEMAGKYRVGQSLGVFPDGRFNNHKFNHVHQSLTNQVRLYSIASACWGDDWHGNTVSLCVKRELGEDAETGELVMGSTSNFICDAQPGDSINVTGPVGRSFLLPEDPLNYHYVLVATGTGIAPYRGMIIELFNQGFEGEVWLIFGVPYSTDIMYDDAFTYFSERHPNFHYHTAISREKRNAKGERFYVQDALEENQGQLAPLLEKPNCLMYLCGLKGMEYGVYPWLYRIKSNLVALPEDMALDQIEKLPRDAREWIRIERSRDKKRLLKETY